MGTAMLRVCALCALLLSAVPPASASGDLGLSLKTGEGGGGIGAQLAYNFTPHWQAALGVGGAGIPYLIILDMDNTRTDSYSLLGKYYWKHVYLSTGYSLKRTRVYKKESGIVHRASAASHGIPLHLGYEFGNRKGFYFSASAGLFYVFRNGGAKVMGPGEEAWSDARTVDTGAGLGFTLGYYFDVFGP
jgi:hypothetical protein